jgi:hypothetical protein
MNWAPSARIRVAPIGLPGAAPAATPGLVDYSTSCLVEVEDAATLGGNAKKFQIEPQRCCTRYSACKLLDAFKAATAGKCRGHVYDKVSEPDARSQRLVKRPRPQLDSIIDGG